MEYLGIGEHDVQSLQGDLNMSAMTFRGVFLHPTFEPKRFIVSTGLPGGAAGVSFLG